MYLVWIICELPDIKAGFRKGRGTKIKLPTPIGSSKKQESSRKTSTSALLTTPMPLTVWITTKCGKFFKSWEHQTTWPASWEICMQIKKQQLEQDMKQQTGSKLGKEYVYVCILSYVCYVYWVCILGKTVYCYPVYLTYIQSVSWKMLAWMKHELESRLREKCQ